MKKVLSIDPGLINLGLFLIQTESIIPEKPELVYKNHTILYWDCVSLVKKGESNQKKVCQGFNKDGKECKFEARYEGILENKTEQEPDKEKMNSDSQSGDSQSRNQESQKEIQEYKEPSERNFKEVYYCAKHNKQNKELKLTLIRKGLSLWSFQTLTDQIIETMENLFSKPEFADIDYILIEDQAKSNERTKFVSGVIFTMCCLHYKKALIQKIPAKYKLTVYEGPEIECRLKSKYAQNKFLSIKHIEALFSESSYWLDFFKKYKKLDDICDSALSALYFVKNNYKIHTHKKIKVNDLVKRGNANKKQKKTKNKKEEQPKETKKYKPRKNYKNKKNEISNKKE